MLYEGITRFASDTTLLFDHPVDASPDRIREASEYVRGLASGGGTEIVITSYSIHYTKLYDGMSLIGQMKVFILLGGILLVQEIFLRHALGERIIQPVWRTS